MDILKKINVFQDFERQVNRLVKSLNQNQFKALLGSIYSNIFWFEKGACFSSTTKLQVSFLKRFAKFCTNLLDAQLVPLEINANGVIIDREFTGFTALQYEGLLKTKGNWSRFLDLDSFHCYWINDASMKIICYCEGDLITRTAINLDMLMLEKDSIMKWHIENE